MKRISSLDIRASQPFEPLVGAMTWRVYPLSLDTLFLWENLTAENCGYIFRTTNWIITDICFEQFSSNTRVRAPKLVFNHQFKPFSRPSSRLNLPRQGIMDRLPNLSTTLSNRESEVQETWTACKLPLWTAILHRIADSKDDKLRGALFRLLKRHLDPEDSFNFLWIHTLEAANECYEFKGLDDIFAHEKRLEDCGPWGSSQS